MKSILLGVAALACCTKIIPAQAQTAELHDEFRLLVQRGEGLVAPRQSSETLHVMESKGCQSWIRMRFRTPGINGNRYISQYHIRWNRNPRIRADGLTFIVDDVAQANGKATLYAWDKDEAAKLLSVMNQLKAACQGRPDEPSIRPADDSRQIIILPDYTRTAEARLNGQVVTCRLVSVPQLVLLADDQEARYTLYSATGALASLELETSSLAFDNGELNVQLADPDAQPAADKNWGGDVEARLTLTSTKSPMRITVSGSWYDASHFSLYGAEGPHIFAMLRLGGTITASVPTPQGRVATATFDIEDDVPAILRTTGFGC